MAKWKWAIVALAAALGAAHMALVVAFIAERRRFPMGAEAINWALGL